MNLEKIFALKDVNLMKDLFDKNKQLFKSNLCCSCGESSRIGDLSAEKIARSPRKMEK